MKLYRGPCICEPTIWNSLLFEHYKIPIYNICRQKNFKIVPSPTDNAMIDPSEGKNKTKNLQPLSRYYSLLLDGALQYFCHIKICSCVKAQPPPTPPATKECVLWRSKSLRMMNFSIIWDCCCCCFAEESLYFIAKSKENTLFPFLNSWKCYKMTDSISLPEHLRTCRLGELLQYTEVQLWTDMKTVSQVQKAWQKQQGSWFAIPILQMWTEVEMEWLSQCQPVWGFIRGFLKSFVAFLSLNLTGISMQKLKKTSLLLGLAYVFKKYSPKVKRKKKKIVSKRV